MANSWLRLWHDMPNDPKWRTIAKISKRSLAEVQAVYIHLLVIASANANERGRTQTNGANSSECSENLAAALDMEIAEIDAILDAMQGRVLDGDLIRGWKKRQVDREDGSAERGRAWREAKKLENLANTERTPNANERKRTQTNANERKRTQDKDKDKDQDQDQDQKIIAESAIAESATPSPEPETELPVVREKKQNPCDLLEAYGITGQLAQDFIAHRKTKRAGISRTVLDGMAREASKAGLSVADAAAMTIERNWQGFKSDWTINTTTGQKNATNTGRYRLTTEDINSMDW